MKITKMALGKSALSAMFFITSFSYNMNAYAGVCEAEFNDWERRYNDLLNNHNIARSVNAKPDDIRKKREIYQDSLLSGRFFTSEDGDKDINEAISRFEQYAKNHEAGTASRESDVLYGRQSVADIYHSICMLKAERDGTLKSTKQAKNNRTSNTAEAKQSKSDKSSQSQSANTTSQDASNQDASNTDTSSNTKPLTKAELKAQKAEQAAQAAEQDVQQDTQLAQENQAKANKARQGKRRRHEPENEAHNCIKPDFGGLYGGMENTCNFKVWYTYCGYHPTENSWLTGMNCEKQSFGSDIVGPGKQDAAHTKGVEKLYWFACKDPAWPVDVEFVDGDIKGRCHTVGGGSD